MVERYTYRHGRVEGEQACIDDTETVRKIDTIAKAIIALARLYGIGDGVPHEIVEDFRVRITELAEQIDHPTVRACVEQDFLAGFTTEEVVQGRMEAEDIEGLYEDGVAGAARAIEEAWNG